MKSKQQGFTLLEIMVVIVIIGLSAAVITLNFNSNPEKQAVEKEVRKLSALIEVLSNEATLTGAILGIETDEQGYRLALRNPEYQPYKKQTDTEISANPEPQWLPLSDDRINGEVQLEQVELKVFVEGFAMLEQEEDGDDFIGESTFEEADPFNSKNSAKQKSIKPQIMIFPSGEVTPFEAEFIHLVEEELWQRIAVDALGQVRIARFASDFSEEWDGEE